MKRIPSKPRLPVGGNRQDIRGEITKSPCRRRLTRPRHSPCADCFTPLRGAEARNQQMVADETLAELARAEDG